MNEILSAITAIAIMLALSLPASAQRYMMYGGNGWGAYRYWGMWGTPGGYYNPGMYRWNGFRPWAHRNYY